jgi:hypothetical protein
MAKRMILGLLLVVFGLLYNWYRTGIEQPKPIKKQVFLIKHDYESEVLWIDLKFYAEIGTETFILENAPKGSYRFVDYRFEIKKDSTNLVIKKK